MSGFDKAANDLIRDVWNDLQRRSRERELQAIRGNPDRHRLTRIMSAGSGTGYTFAAGPATQTKRKRERTLFCVAKRKNAAGVFLIWRQVDRYKRKAGRWQWIESERFDFQWTPTRREGLDLIRRKARKAIDVAAPKPKFEPTPGRGIGEALNV